MKVSQHRFYHTFPIGRGVKIKDIWNYKNLGVKLCAQKVGVHMRSVASAVKVFEIDGNSKT